MHFFLASLAAVFLPEMLQLFTLSRLSVVREAKQVQDSCRDLEGLIQLSTSANKSFPAFSQSAISDVSLAVMVIRQLVSMSFIQLSRVVRESEMKENVRSYW